MTLAMPAWSTPVLPKDFRTALLSLSVGLLGILLHVLMGIEFVSAPVYILILIFNPATQTTSYHVGSVRSILPILTHTAAHQDSPFSAIHHLLSAQTTHAVVGTSLGVARSTQSNHETSPEMTMFYHNGRGFAPREGRMSIMYRWWKHGTSTTSFWLLNAILYPVFNLDNKCTKIL